jgi:hypothetical protein
MLPDQTLPIFADVLPLTICPLCGCPVAEASWSRGQARCRDCGAALHHPDDEPPMPVTPWPVCPKCGLRLPEPVCGPVEVRCVCGCRVRLEPRENGPTEVRQVGR